METRLQFHISFLLLLLVVSFVRLESAGSPSEMTTTQSSTSSITVKASEKPDHSGKETLHIYQFLSSVFWHNLLIPNWCLQYTVMIMGPEGMKLPKGCL